jgi:hypothetical protein
MKTKDLIKQLQTLVDNHEPHLEIMGEHEIVIDVFCKTEKRGCFEYKGVSPNILIDKSSDGVYDILTAEESF